MTAFISRAYGSKEWEVIIKTDNKDHYKYAELFARKLIDHGKTHTMTNADRIRAMSDEELAAYLVYHNPYSTEEFCLKWLRQPVKDGDNDG